MRSSSQPSADATVRNAPRARILTPRQRSGPRFPRIPGVGLGLWAIAFASSVGWSTTSLRVPAASLAALCGVLSACSVASWAEARLFHRLRGAPVTTRLLRHLGLPLAAVSIGVLSTWGLDLGLARLGYDGSLLLVVTASGVWALGASFGTVLIVVLDAGVTVLGTNFRRRIQALALSLLAIAVVSAVVLAPWVFASLNASDRGIATLWRADLLAPTFSRLAGVPGVAALLRASRSGVLFVLVVTLFFGVPSVLSASSKFAGLVMERIYPLTDAFDAVAEGERSIRVEEGGSDEFVHLSRRFNRMVELLSSAESMERAFGSYVSAQVLTRIRAQQGKAQIPGTLREATVFFCDIRGFTAMSERLPPQEVVQVLNRFFACAVEVVDAHEGYLNKFIGDAIVVVFNGPIDQADHAERAIRCAIALQRAVAELNERSAFAHVDAIGIGVGIATGVMICGSVGSSRQMEYTVIGDVVNTAARLCARAAAGEVWTNRQAFDARPSDIPASSVLSIEVKGKKEPVEAAVVWPPARHPMCIAPGHGSDPPRR